MEVLGNTTEADNLSQPQTHSQPGLAAGEAWLTSHPLPSTRGPQSGASDTAAGICETSLGWPLSPIVPHWVSVEDP